MEAAVGGGIEFPSPVAMDFTEETTPGTAGRLQRRIEKRLLEAKRNSPGSVEEIEAKLREADLRRQQFHEFVSFKARRKAKSPSWSSQEEDLGQRLEAKLFAAEQKRLNLLDKAQRRLARLDELRQAAKNGVEMRFEKEREELGTKVESRVRQAEANRMRLLNAYMQRKAALRERTAKSLVQRITRENRYKERVKSAIFQKRAAAEKKRLAFLEAEKRKAQARVMQAQQVAKNICSQREIERRRLKEQLEDRLQRAKRQRAEYLRQRGSPRNSVSFTWYQQRDFLSRKLARCWRKFVRSRKTTFTLAKAFLALNINEKSLMSIPFEQLALSIGSETTLQTTKSLLDRLESRFLLFQSSCSSAPENIDHLLKRLVTPRSSSGKGSRSRGQSRKSVRSSEANKPSRYAVRVALSAYMILGQSSAVFSDHGEREKQLMESAGNFIKEFEFLVSLVLNGPESARRDDMLDDERSSRVSCGKSFRSELLTFDAAWCSYLYHFVLWKTKDAKSLEEDLIRIACQLELSMLQTCKVTSDGQATNLSHDSRAIQKQVMDDQRLLREKVQHLSGIDGIERMETALSKTRAKFFEANEDGDSTMTPIAPFKFLSPQHSYEKSLSPEEVGGDRERSKHVARRLFVPHPSRKNSAEAVHHDDTRESGGTSKQAPTENEIIVNEILHGNSDIFPQSSEVGGVSIETDIKAKVKETMERAFWDGIRESMGGDKPDYSRILGLVKEVRDELCDLAPGSWRQNILDSIDVEILSQVLESGLQDSSYLGEILQYSLSMLQKLAAPAVEDEMKKSHQRLLNELADILEFDGERDNSFILGTVKGLRYVLEEIQNLKKEVGNARLHLLEPFLRGSAGLDYLQMAFHDRYGTPSGAATSLPMTLQWILRTRNNLEEEWCLHLDSLSYLPADHPQPLVTTLRSGGATSSQQMHLHPTQSGESELPECRDERLDKLLRVGLLQLATRNEAVMATTVPETFMLNALRLRAAQGQYQQVIVTATSMLILRQILISDFSITSAAWLESLALDFVEKLTKMLDTVTDLGMEEIVELMTSCSDVELEVKLKTKKEIVAQMLVKSLQDGDPVFSKVSKSVYSAFRGVVLGGSGTKGRKLAEAELRRIGAAATTDRVIKAAELLIKMAMVSGRVHEPWYSNLLLWK